MLLPEQHDRFTQSRKRWGDYDVAMVRVSTRGLLLDELNGFLAVL
jgi:hypothetical protein